MFGLTSYQLPYQLYLYKKNSDYFYGDYTQLVVHLIRSLSDVKWLQPCDIQIFQEVALYGDSRMCKNLSIYLFPLFP